MVIDIGNSLTKTAVFNEYELASFSSFEKFSMNALNALCFGNPSVKNSILSSVIEHDKEIPGFLKNRHHFIELSSETRIPIENLYDSPQTLGKDRLVAAVGANSLFDKQNVLAIDAGTCIKYDFVNHKNQYMGGGISPGIEMRFKALNTFTGKLPLLTYQYMDKLIGRNTDESILSGVMNGAAEEVKGIIKRYERQYPGMKIIFTGGYLKFFEKIFNIPGGGNSNLFTDPFLVLKGLNRILMYNTE